MSSPSAIRKLLGRLLLAFYVKSFQWSVLLTASDGYQVGQYYYPSANSDLWAQPSVNNYDFNQPINSIVPTPAKTMNVGVYNGRVNNYDVVPGYEGYRRPSNNRYIWDDPYVRWQWNNYYKGYNYPSASDSGWNDRNDEARYYSKRRQDSVQLARTTSPATTTTSVRPSVPRKKKLFVPNVWG